MRALSKLSDHPRLPHQWCVAPCPGMPRWRLQNTPPRDGQDTSLPSLSGESGSPALWAGFFFAPLVVLMQQGYPRTTMFTWFKPRTDPAVDKQALADLQSRVLDVERGLVALRDDLLAWEARAAKITRELSRHLKSIAEVERRERIKRGDDADLDGFELEEEDLVTRTLNFGKRNGEPR